MNECVESFDKRYTSSFSTEVAFWSVGRAVGITWREK